MRRSDYEEMRGAVGRASVLLDQAVDRMPRQQPRTTGELAGAADDLRAAADRFCAAVDRLLEHADAEIEAALVAPSRLPGLPPTVTVPPIGRGGASLVIEGRGIPEPIVVREGFDQSEGG